MNQYLSIGDLLNRQCTIHSDNRWLTFYPEQGERTEYTYGEFYELLSRTANILLSHGVQSGDKVATVSYNHSDTVIQYFACWLIGAVVVPINVGEDDKRIGYILQNSQARLAFVRDIFVARIESILTEIQSPVTIVNVSDKQPAASLDIWNSIQNSESKSQKLPDVSIDSEALIVYTSGTTGLPKGVVLTQYNLLCDAKAITDWHGIQPDQQMMCVLPIHHVNGTVVTLLTPMYAGCSVVLNQKFHSGTFFNRVADEQVTIVSVVPTLLQFLLHEKEKSNLPAINVRCLRHIICGAGPLTVELALKFEEEFKIPIIHGYGLSETTCYSCFLPIELTQTEHTHWLKDFGFPSIGVPLPVNEMAIMDEQGNMLPEEKKGEIVIRGHNVMKEYFANPEANEKAFAFGWFHSGDEGFYKLDETGKQYFFITGRIKELIIRGGINISPFEIDEVLMNMPGVKAGIAFGFENDWYGEEIGAYVQTKDGVTLTEADVIAYCRKYFPYSKCPKVVLFGNEIPVTSTGKYQRNKLKRLFEEWKSVQFK